VRAHDAVEHARRRRAQHVDAGHAGAQSGVVLMRFPTLTTARRARYTQRDIVG
jgi:hypothetical protein